MRPFDQEREREDGYQGRPQVFPILAAQGWGASWGRARGLAQLEVKHESSSATYPGSRKARLSGTARVPIGSLGTSKAAGPSLSGGSLHGGEAGSQQAV